MDADHLPDPDSDFGSGGSSRGTFLTGWLACFSSPNSTRDFIFVFSEFLSQTMILQKWTVMNE